MKFSTRGGKEKLVDVVSWEKSGEKQAHMFIETWTRRDPKNLAAYEFIVANGLYTVEKKED
ncbi:glucose-methanol-choline oxidoreductase N-terminal domain-containing protein [Lactobacillus phage CV244]|nr:glucose-methanol-choline oxidoreductase N-terminal domain-containing protein [Lactobacillus phage CV244]